MFVHHQDETDRLLRTLEAMVGVEEVSRRLTAFEREIAGVDPDSIFNQWWFTPQNTLWLTLRGARRVWAQGGVVRDVLQHVPLPGLSAASTITAVAGIMPESRRKKFASDLLTAENITAVLIEAETSLEWLNDGFQITWQDETGRDAHLSSEFIAQKAGVAFAVECKASSVDAGLGIHRKHACLFVDEVKDALSEKRRLTGEIYLSFDKFPTSPQERSEAISWLLSRIDAGDTRSAASWIEFEAALSEQDNNPINLEEFVAMKRTDKDGRLAFSHTIILMRRHPEGIYNPIVFRFGIKKQDKFVRAIKDNIRKASGQLQATHEFGFLRYHIPEIEDFASPNTQRFLRHMAEWLFSSHERSHIFAVQFVSDMRLSDSPEAIVGGYPHATVINPHLKDFPAIPYLVQE